MSNKDPVLHVLFHDLEQVSKHGSDSLDVAAPLGVHSATSPSPLGRHVSTIDDLHASVLNTHKLGHRVITVVDLMIDMSILRFALREDPVRFLSQHDSDDIAGLQFLVRESHAHGCDDCARTSA